MVYECEKCAAPLPPGVMSCPQCGDRFEQAVPYDAEEPKQDGAAAGNIQGAREVGRGTSAAAPPTKKANPLHIAILVGAIPFILYMWHLGDDPAASSAPPSSPPAAGAADVKPVYTLDSSEDCTVDQDKPCRRISITVPKGQSRAQIASDLTHVAQNAKASYGTVRGIAFASAEGTDKNGAYSAGRAEWGPDELTDKVCTADAPQIDYVDDYFKPEAASPASVRRIPEARRKQIYYQIGLSEDRATHDADAALPIVVPPERESREAEDQAQHNVIPNMKLNSSLTEKYHARVQRHYRLSDNQFSDIIGEGVQKHWPSPDPATD